MSKSAAAPTQPDLLGDAPATQKKPAPAKAEKKAAPKPNRRQKPKPAPKPKPKNQLARVEPKQQVAKGTPGSALELIQVIERIASNKEVPVEKMQAVLDMQERIINRNAKAAFDAKFSEMQAALPPVDKKGWIEIRDKVTKEVIQRTSFAKWEHIHPVIMPVLAEFGFSLRFRSAIAPDGRLKITGVLSGWGHREETEYTLPYDATGSKNNVQAIGSSASYGKRYATLDLLNILTKEQDDDGLAGGGTPASIASGNITAEQAEEIVGLIQTINAKTAMFCEAYKIDMVAQLPAGRFAEAKKRLQEAGYNNGTIQRPAGTHGH